MLRRILIRGALLGLVSIGVGVVAIHLQQRLLRSRAESLLLDIRSLDLRKSNWQDAQNIFTRWGASGHYDGLCTESSCDYRIELGDFFLTHARWISLVPRVRRVYEFLGVRMSVVQASVFVQDGLVWGKGFSLFLDVPPETGPNALVPGYGYTLIGRVETVSRFSSSTTSWPQLTLHPGYTVSTPSGCTACLAAIVRFTPFADPSDVARLMDFNLDCLTRRTACRTREDLMPTAWKQYLAEKPLNSAPAPTEP